MNNYRDELGREYVPQPAPPDTTASDMREIVRLREDLEQALALIRDYRSMPIGPMTVDDAAATFPMWAPLTIRADALLDAARQRLDPFIRLAPPAIVQAARGDTDEPRGT